MSEKLLEKRFVSLFEESTELRFTDGTDAQPPRFVGLIPFNSLSVDLGGFRERIMPTAFRSTLASGADIRALANHNSDQLLGRITNKTLRVAETDKGLAVEIDMPNVSYANDLRELVKRGDIRGLSFGFLVDDKGQKFVSEGGQTIRELHDIKLREVSLVTMPAYPDTSVAVRSAVIDAAVVEHIRTMSLPDLSFYRKRLHLAEMQ